MPQTGSGSNLNSELLNISGYRKYIKDSLLIIVGIASATLGLEGFLLPNGFLDGGVTGISLLASQVTGVSVSLLIFIINIPFILIGIKQVSKEFAIKTTLAIAGLALAVTFVHFPIITDDKLLIAVFGGLFLGAGIGLAMRGGGVIDGTEVLAIFISRKTSLTVGDVITVFNVILFSVSALLINVETALYSMLTYITASKTIDFLINGIEEYIGVTIVSELYEPLRKKITEDLGRGVTVYKAESGFGDRDSSGIDRKIIFCVVTRLEVQRLLTEIKAIDQKAFVIQHTINDTKGGMIKQRPLH